MDGEFTVPSAQILWSGLAGIILILLILVVWSVFLTVHLNKARTRLNKMIGGSGVADLEQVLANLHARVGALEFGHAGTSVQITEIFERLRHAKINTGISRYNGFGERGNDLSFSIAIVDDGKTGLVFTGIHGREQTFVYAKPVQQGTSSYPLTPEETEVIQAAVNRK